MIRRTTVRLDEHLLAAAHKHARATGRTLTSLLEEGLRRVMGRDDRPRRRTRLHVLDGGPDPDLTWDQIKASMHDEEIGKIAGR